MPKPLKNAGSIDIAVTWSPDYKNNKGPTFEFQVYCGEKGCTLKNLISAKETAKFTEFFYRFLNTIAKNIAANNRDQPTQQMSLTSEIDPHWSMETTIINISLYAAVNLVCILLLVISARLCANNLRDLRRFRESLRIAAPQMSATQLDEIPRHLVPTRVNQNADIGAVEAGFPYSWIAYIHALENALSRR